MNLFELTRALVDIESTTNHEEKVGDYLFAHLSAIAARHNGQVERIPVEPNRDNVLAFWGEPMVTFSTTWIPSRRSSLRMRTTNSSGVADPAMQKASLPP